MTTPTPTPPDLPHVDPWTFTTAERMALQRQFDCDYSDLFDAVAGKASGRLRGKTDSKLIDGNKKIHFADEVLAAMIIIVAHRTDPTATAESLGLDVITWDQLIQVLLPSPKAGKPATSRRTT